MKVTEKTADSNADTGQISTTKVGGHGRFKHDDNDQWIDELMAATKATVKMGILYV